MKVLFLQISDIHWQQSEQPHAERFLLASRCLPAHFVDPVDAVLFVYGGDFAWSGKPEEYDGVWLNLATFEEQVKQAFGASVEYYSVGVPGNHDCDFSRDQSARDALLQGISHKNGPQLHGAITDILLKPQSAFFDFHHSLASSGSTALWPIVDSRLAWKHDFEIQGELLRVNCFNTAWMSRLREQQGALFMPNKETPASQVKEVTLEIALLHHPLTWLEAMNSNKARRFLLESSDMIFTGHEHAAAALDAELKGVGNASIFEALPFLDSDSPSEGLTAIYVDTASKKRVHIDFIWNGNSFDPYQQGAIITPAQAVIPLDLVANRHRQNRKWEFTEAFQEHLQNPELDLMRVDRAPVRLQDIFTCPDLRELKPEANYEVSVSLPGENALTKLSSFEIAFLVGPDNCGKTALAKMLVHTMRNDGLLPILVSGKDVPKNPDKFKATICETVEAQYGQGLADRFLNTPLADRAILIDDFQAINEATRRKHQIIDLAKRFAARVIIFSHDTELGPSDFGMFMLRSGPRVRVINIPPFTFDRRAAFIEKWLSISPSYGKDPEVDQRKEAECHHLVNTIVGRNYIQPFAPYILAVLQSVESGHEVDLSASTHGHLYEVFIKTALSRRRTQTNYNVITAFLATLAMEAFENDRRGFGMDFLRQAHARFERETDLTRDVEALAGDLVSIKLLTKRSGDYFFREDYIYYYFVAFYLKDRISDPRTQNVIKECASRAWVADYANVLLFLAHLSKDRFIVDTVLAVAKSTFDHVPAARLEGEISVLIETSLPQLKLAEDAEIARKERLVQQQQVAEEVQLTHASGPMRRDATFEEISFVGQLSAALKVLQILGQMLKNFPANFDPNQKVEIVNECIDLGLRTLGKYFEYAEEGKAELLAEFAAMIRAQLPGISQEDALDKASTAIANLCHMASFGVVKRLSYAIGSPELSKTYQKVFSSNQTPARLLVELSMKLDRSGDFPEQSILAFAEAKHSNYFALRLLRHLVVRHFRLFHRDFKLRQRIGSKIGISYQKTIGPSSEKLLGDSKTKG